MTREAVESIAGLQTTVVQSATAGNLLVVLLHGYSMRPGDLSPFAHSISVAGTFLLPQGPVAVEGGHAWWEIDGRARAQAQRLGPRDLAAEYPENLEKTRALCASFVSEACERYRPSAIVVGGFSQGGMLACDCVLNGAFPSIAGLFLLSASRIAFDSWRGLRSRLLHLPVLVSHGRADGDLAFSAGEALRDFAADAGALVTWVPFDEGHEIPLVVWRQLRKFLSKIQSS